MRLSAGLRFAPIGLLVLASLTARAGDVGELTGTWRWTWKDADGMSHKHVLEVESTGGKASARERFDEREAVKVTDLKLDGKTVTFTVTRGKRRAAYKGKLDADNTLTGTVTVGDEGQTSEYGWEATRDKVKKEPKKSLPTGR